MSLMATFTWRAPGGYFFLEGEIPPDLERDDALLAVCDDIAEFLRTNPSLLALEDYYNVSGCLSYVINGETLAPDEGDDLESEGGGRFQVEVSIRSELKGNPDPESFHSLSGEEIYSRLLEYANLEGESEAFQISATFLKD